MIIDCCVFAWCFGVCFVNGVIFGRFIVIWGKT